jgi:DNA (cytosine-5)-methyltransferase 1
MNVIWQSEIDPYGCRVLKKHWPEVVNHGNIKEINWGDVVRPDIICGGYPCQPFSTAGKRNGTDDPRHLWPWVREAISELRPKYAILENVRGHVSLGLNVVLGEMASIGYDAEWQIVSAASVGAPHRRDRVIIAAYPRKQLEHGRGHFNSQSALRQGQAVQEPVSGSNSLSANTIGQLANPDSLGHLRRQSQIFTTERWLNALSLIGSCSTDVANTDSIGLEGQGAEQQTTGIARSCKNSWEPMADNDSERDGVIRSQGAAREARQFRGHNSGREEANVSREWWQVEPDVGRVANGVPSRVDRLRGLGNAVVPQVAELVGRMVIDYDNQ